MWQMFKSCCSSPAELIKTIIQIIIGGAIGAAWFYIVALSIILIGG